MSEEHTFWSDDLLIKNTHIVISRWKIYFEIQKIFNLFLKFENIFDFFLNKNEKINEILTSSKKNLNFFLCLHILEKSWNESSINRVKDFKREYGIVEKLSFGKKEDLWILLDKEVLKYHFNYKL